MEGAIFTNHFSKDDPSPKVQAFVTQYKAKYGETPDGFAALSYDAAGLLLDALKTSGSTDSAAIRDALQNTTFSGIAGAYKFNENRDPIKAAYILQIKDGQQTYLATVNP